MSSKPLKIAVFFLLLLLYGSLLIYEIELPAALDLPRQISNGQMIFQGHFEVITKNVYSYVEPGQPFANHHWLSGVIFYLMYISIGWIGMNIAKIFFLLSTFSLLFWIARKNSNFWLVSLVSIPALAIFISRTALRPEMFSYLLVPIFLYFLLDLEQYPEHNRVFWLVPLQILWVNLHLFFGVGVVMAIGFLFEQLVFHYKSFKNNIIIQKLALVCIFLIVAIFINPYGLKGAGYAFWVNSNKNFPISSAEINSINNVLRDSPTWKGNFSAFIFQPLVIVLVLSFLIALIFRWRFKKQLFSRHFLFYLAGSMGTSLLCFFVIRALPFFGMMFFLAMCANLNDIFIAIKNKVFTWIPKFNDVIKYSFIVFCLGVIIGSFIFSYMVFMQGMNYHLGLGKWAKASAIFFKEQGLRGPIFNDTDIGSYLIGELYPQEQVFSDNRFGDAYSASFFSNIYLPMIQDEEVWKKKSEEYHINTIFFNHYDAVSGARDFLYHRFWDKEWALVYVDPYVMIFLKNVSENANIIDKFHITNENLVEKLKYLSGSREPGEQLAAADIFNLFGRIDLSMPTYLRVVSQEPSRGKVWMVLGRTELTKSNQQESNPYLAAIYLERAIKEGWKTWESYSYLALAYFRTGQYNRAREAVRQELKIDPKNSDGQKWLGILAEQPYQ